MSQFWKTDIRWRQNDITFEVVSNKQNDHPDIISMQYVAGFVKPLLMAHLGIFRTTLYTFE